MLALYDSVADYYLLAPNCLCALVVVMHDDELGTDSKLFHSNFLQHLGKVKK
jgi:hypothetical protein